MKKYEWMRNDTAAIMFSAIDDNYNSRIFRISAVFKDEEIDSERLEKVVKLTMPRYPICMYRNNRGLTCLFCNKSEKTPLIKQQTPKKALTFFGVICFSDFIMCSS